MIDAGAEIGDQAQLFAGMGQHGGIDPVGDRRHQNIGDFHRLAQLRLRHRAVIDVKLGVEQLHHSGLDGVGQLTGNDDQRLFRCHRGILPMFEPS